MIKFQSVPGVSLVGNTVLYVWHVNSVHVDFKYYNTNDCDTLYSSDPKDPNSNI